MTKERCRGDDHELVDSGDLELVGTTLIHKRKPWHRIIDGAVVVVVGDGNVQVDASGEPRIVWSDPVAPLQAPAHKMQTQ